MGNQNSLKETVFKTEPLYRASLANRLYHSPVARRAAVMGATVAVVAAGVHFLAPPEAAETFSGISYSFGDGFNDGIFAPVSLALDQILGKSAAVDGTGITSGPANGYYSIGFGTGVLIPSLLVNELIHVSKNFKRQNSARL